MLRGEIGEFTIAEILQMIGLQEKTGMLRIRSRGKLATIFFEAGKLISTRDRRLITKDPFLEYLEQKQIVRPDQANKIMEIKQSSGGDTLEILDYLNLIDRNKLAGLLKEYSIETLETIIKWESGSFEFVPVNDSLPEKKLIKPIPIEPLLMEALRRRDEVEEIKRFLPPADSRLKIAVREIEELPLENEERTVLDLINGERTIEEIVELNQPHEVETLDILEKLFALGIIAISEEKPSQVTTKEVDPRITYLVAGMIIAISLIIRIIAVEVGQSQFSTMAETISRFVDDREIENIRFAIECYQYIHRSYPTNLGDLVREKLVSGDGISNFNGSQYRYILLDNQSGYIIENPSDSTQSRIDKGEP
ncbi:MAG: DUF4388 domain-containing protein [bacterium]